MPPQILSDDAGPSDGFDPQALLERLARAGAEHARVVEQRPNKSQVAEAFQQFGSLLHQWGDACRRIAAFSCVEDPDQTGPTPGFHSSTPWRTPTLGSWSPRL